ncbi:MAG: FAD-dependent oxidoreductase [SAR202 cluster bacterium]|jgi:glycine/D-amino acid oxidase-like deaminating enzyme|nr:FAD-dependent oxidoreductase [SAR202 cluster bacterium]
MNVAIVGAGIFGMAAAIEISGRGHTVTVFDQGSVPYENAASTDVSKGIRRMWYAGDNETYVELVESAAAKWRHWERILEESVYHQTGGISIIDSFGPGTPMYESWRYLIARGATEIEVMTAPKARKRFPQFVIDDEETVVHDRWSGYIESGHAVKILARIARDQGVIITEETRVTEVTESSTGATVKVGEVEAKYDRIVVAAGVWVGRLLPTIGENVKVTHQEMLLIEVEDEPLFSPPNMPVWGVDPDGEGWYGFPLLREGCVKVSKEPLGEVVDPDFSRGGTEEFRDETLEFLRGRIPKMADGRVVSGRTCLYTTTPDDHFVIDWAPGYESVLVAGGGSGHGFKFGGSIGSLISDALEDRDNPLGRRFRIGDRFTKTPTCSQESRGFATPRET